MVQEIGERFQEFISDISALAEETRSEDIIAALRSLIDHPSELQRFVKRLRDAFVKFSNSLESVQPDEQYSGSFSEFRKDVLLVDKYLGNISNKESIDLDDINFLEDSLKGISAHVEGLLKKQGFASDLHRIKRRQRRKKLRLVAAVFAFAASAFAASSTAQAQGEPPTSQRQESQETAQKRAQALRLLNQLFSPKYRMGARSLERGDEKFTGTKQAGQSDGVYVDEYGNHIKFAAVENDYTDVIITIFDIAGKYDFDAISIRIRCDGSRNISGIDVNGVKGLSQKRLRELIAQDVFSTWRQFRDPLYLIPYGAKGDLFQYGTTDLRGLGGLLSRINNVIGCVRGVVGENLE